MKNFQQQNQNLTEDQIKVIRDGGTEAPFTGELYDNHKKGMYKCINCGIMLFSSDTKFDSGTGWPSFDKPENLEAVELIPDMTGGMMRTEVRCKNCGAHLGHVFDDGPRETTGKRFCINSCSLDFEEKK